MNALVIEPGPTLAIIDIPDDDGQLETMQAAVGGLIQIIPAHQLGDHVACFCNEDLWSLPDHWRVPNHTANDMLGGAWLMGPPIIGPLLICGQNPANENALTELPTETHARARLITTEAQGTTQDRRGRQTPGEHATRPT